MGPRYDISTRKFKLFQIGGMILNIVYPRVSPVNHDQWLFEQDIV